MFDVGRSMFDVPSIHCSGQTEFHISGAAGLKSGQFNQKSYIFVINDVSHEASEFSTFDVET
jgi:hypothetical protein